MASRRLIDANEAEKILFDLRKGFRHVDEKCAVGACILELKYMPTVDAVEVVRCKDCKHFKDWGDGNKTCYFWTDQWDMPTVEDAFCSYGERRTDNG